MVAGKLKLVNTGSSFPTDHDEHFLVSTALAAL